MSPYSTAVADSLAPNPFEWRRVEKPTVLTPEQIKDEAHRADMLARYHARTAHEKAERSYATRFKTPEALEAHRAKARIYDKVQREKAAMVRNAKRVNPESHSGFTRTQVDSDKTARLVGRRNESRTQ